MIILDYQYVHGDLSEILSLLLVLFRERIFLLENILAERNLLMDKAVLIEAGETNDAVVEPKPLEKAQTFELRVLKAIRRIIRSVDIYSRRLNREYSLTTPQLICLSTLHEAGTMTNSELSKEVSLSASTVNGVVDRLETKGLVIRRRSERDKRRVCIEITGPGMELVKKAPPLLQEHLTAALNGLPDLEQAAITLSLERVVQLMGIEDIDASPNLLPDGQIISQKEEGHK